MVQGYTQQDSGNKGDLGKFLPKYLTQIGH